MSGGQILKDAIDTLNDSLDGYGNSNIKSLDISNGGFAGILPNIGITGDDGVVNGNWISNTPATTGMVYARLIDYPKGFDMCGSDASKILNKRLSNLFSRHAEVIEGLNDTINVDYDDSIKVGRSGGSLHTETNATMTATEIQISVTEKLGNPIKALLRFIIKYLIMDPDTGSALAFLLPNYEKGAWTADKKSFALLVYEVSPTGDTVINAQLVVNMMPKNDGEYVFKKDISGAKEVRKYSVGFTGLALRGREYITMAQTYVDEVMSNTIDAMRAPALYTDAVAEVKADSIGNTTVAGSGANL